MPNPVPPYDPPYDPDDPDAMRAANTPATPMPSDTKPDDKPLKFSCFLHGDHEGEQCPKCHPSEEIIEIDEHGNVVKFVDVQPEILEIDEDGNVTKPDDTLDRISERMARIARHTYFSLPREMLCSKADQKIADALKDAGLRGMVEALQRTSNAGLHDRVCDIGKVCSSGEPCPCSCYIGACDAALAAAAGEGQKDG